MLEFPVVQMTFDFNFDSMRFSEKLFFKFAYDWNTIIGKVERSTVISSKIADRNIGENFISSSKNSSWGKVWDIAVDFF